MQYFSEKSFEKLLFPLHKKVYENIDKFLSNAEKQNPGVVYRLVNYEEKFWKVPTYTSYEWETFCDPNNIPRFDILITYTCEKLTDLREIQHPQIMVINPTNIEDEHSGNHLIIRVYGKQKNAYIIPIPFVLNAFEKKVTRENTYQVYQHTLIRDRGINAATNKIDYEKDAGLYVGVTRRSWQKRYLEHRNASFRGSRLLFHRAIRGELFRVDFFEHIVLRAGLSERDALNIEEKEVENRTYNFKHPNGLNMIPGGYAGLRYISKMRNKKIEDIDIENVDKEIEMHINETLNQPGITREAGYTNEKLAELWRTNIRYRIAVMTNNSKRLSYRQIMNVRILCASGWSIEKIHDYLQGVDGRDASVRQIEMLADGKTYETIPHVLIDMD